MKLGKNDLSKIILIIILLLLFIGLAFFRKNENAPRPPEDNQQIDQPAGGGKNMEPTEEEEAEAFAKNFVEIYETYSLGDFSNLELLKNKMSGRLWQEKAIWIDSEKQKAANAPKIFVNFTAVAKAARVNSFESNKAEIEVEYEKTEMRGASIYINDILTSVNEFGEKTADPVPKKTQAGKVTLKLIKEKNEWKMDEINLEI